MFILLAPGHCHPNPCENDGKCIDKYDFFSPEDRRGTRDGSQDTENKFFFHMTRTPGLELITPVDPRILNENGDKSESGNDNAVSSVSQRSYVVKESREKMPSKHSEIVVAKRNHITRSKRYHTSRLKHLRNRKAKRSHIQRPNVDWSWKYSRDVNINNQTLSKRNLILTKKLPANVDQTELEIDGFVCICPEHYKGKKCERKLASSIWIAI